MIQNKESYADSVMQADVRDKIDALKIKASFLAKSLESEKRKNVSLI
jgi:hypothetical protein